MSSFFGKQRLAFGRHVSDCLCHLCASMTWTAFLNCHRAVMCITSWRMTFSMLPPDIVITWPGSSAHTAQFLLSTICAGGLSTLHQKPPKIIICFHRTGECRYGHRRFFYRNALPPTKVLSRRLQLFSTIMPTTGWRHLTSNNMQYRAPR